MSVLIINNVYGLLVYRMKGGARVESFCLTSQITVFVLLAAIRTVRQTGMATVKVAVVV